MADLICEYREELSRYVCHYWNEETEETSQDTVQKVILKKPYVEYGNFEIKLEKGFNKELGELTIENAYPEVEISPNNWRKVYLFGDFNCYELGGNLICQR